RPSSCWPSSSCSSCICSSCSTKSRPWLAGSAGATATTEPRFAGGSSGCLEARGERAVGQALLPTTMLKALSLLGLALMVLALVGLLLTHSLFSFLPIVLAV